MFSGIVETVAVIQSLRPKPRSKVLEIELRRPKEWKNIKKGASISIDGVCLTVTKVSAKMLGFDVISETRRRSSLGNLGPGDRVNLERALVWKGRVEGHFVLGHVDGVGKVRKVIAKTKEKSFLISCPGNLSRYLTEKGSVAVNGVSLTLGKVSKNEFWLHCIPYTLGHTNLGDLRAGSAVNLEVDLLAKLAMKL